jgi:hypothetical protein
MVDTTQRAEVGKGYRRSAPVSLQTIVSSGLVGRLHVRRGVRASAAKPRTRDLAMSIPVASMRLLEASIALTALATALLIGIGR